MLRNESPAELKRKLQKVNVEEVLQKMDEYDKNRLQELGININEMKSRVSESDIAKIKQVLGSDGDRIIRKLQNMLR